MILNGGRGNGNQVLKPETVALMGKNAMGDTRVVMLKTTNPARSEDAEFFPGLPKSWGLTFMINEQAAPTGRSAGSLAWAGLFNTFFWIDPSKGMGGVFMAQVLPFVDPQDPAGLLRLRDRRLSDDKRLKNRARPSATAPPARRARSGLGRIDADSAHASHHDRARWAVRAPQLRSGGPSPNIRKAPRLARTWLQWAFASDTGRRTAGQARWS